MGFLIKFKRKTRNNHLLEVIPGLLMFRQRLARANEPRQPSRNVFSLNFLELTTSTSDGLPPFGGEIVSHRKFLTASQSTLNVLRPSFLELATSFLGASRLRQEKSLAFRKLFGAKALYLTYLPKNFSRWWR